MYFRMLLDEASGALSYLLADLPAGEAVLIDPRGPDLPVLQAMLDEHRLRLRWILRTHAHARTPPTPALGAPEVGGHHALDGATNADLAPPTLLPFGDEHVSVLATPGHTPACLSFRWRDRLFCGDLLSTGECPHQPWPAAPQALWDSVTREVFTLPAETLLFAAHVATLAREGRGATTCAGQGQVVSTVLEQRRRHPWFAQPSRDAFLASVAQWGIGETSPRTSP
jgi:glyoxylase-like metal-dependent hydrolase (beta-lactamase superfamily II)